MQSSRNADVSWVEAPRAAKRVSSYGADFSNQVSNDVLPRAAVRGFFLAAPRSSCVIAASLRILMRYSEKCGASDTTSLANEGSQIMMALLFTFVRVVH